MNLDPVFEDMIRHEELPESSEWLPPLEMSMGGAPGKYPIDVVVGGGLFFGGLIMGLTSEFSGLSTALMLTGAVVYLSVKGHRIVWGDHLRYFRALKKHTTGKEFLVTPEAIYISGSVLASNGYHLQLCQRDRNRMLKLKAEYLKIAYPRLRAFGRRGQFLALYPVDGAAYTKYFYFESYNEHVLELLVKKLSVHVPEEQVTSFEIPVAD